MLLLLGAVFVFAKDGLPHHSQSHISISNGEETISLSRTSDGPTRGKAFFDTGNILVKSDSLQNPKQKFTVIIQPEKGEGIAWYIEGGKFPPELITRITSTSPSCVTVLENYGEVKWGGALYVK